MAHNVDDRVIVKLDYAPELVATVMPKNTIPPLDRLYSMEAFKHTKAKYQRYITPNSGPLYMQGVILCKRDDRTYCVHVPALNTNESLDNNAKHLLIIDNVYTKSNLSLFGCTIHSYPNDMLCKQCKDDLDSRQFLLGLGYVCTIRAVDM